MYCTVQGDFTALMHAAEYGSAVCVRLLLGSGANKEAKDWVRCMIKCPFSASQLIFLTNGVRSVSDFIENEL
jgi:hypothetical protein